MSCGLKDLRLEEQEQPAVDPDEVLINIEAGGICDSDLHYYNHGGFGTVRIKDPMILGHEISGRVAGLGTNVDNLCHSIRGHANSAPRLLRWYSQ